MTKTTGANARVRRRVRIRLAAAIAATALGWLVLSAGATAAGPGRELPPIPAFPRARDTAPPPGAIDPGNTQGVCTDWYPQSAYFGQSAGSTWWEYSCRYEWPVLGVGATTADWSGQYISTAYFYWTGSAAAHYGTSMFDGYSDSWLTATDCDYWWDQPTGRWYGPYDLTAPGLCVR